MSDFSTEDILDLSASCEKYSSHPIATAIREKSKNSDKFLLSNYKETAGFGISANYNGKEIKCGGIKILSEEQKKEYEEYLSFISDD